MLVHHPYHSFATSVQRFIEQAAADPNVLAIKQTLYRTSGDSPIVDALIDAAEAGKQVVVLVEIKARFDEEANITWARIAGAGRLPRRLRPGRAEDPLQDRAGGAPGAAACCAATATSAPATTTRRPPGSTRTSACSPPTREVGADLTDLFNALTGYSPADRLPHAAGRAARHPHRADRADPRARRGTPREGRPAGIRIKVNSLVDERIIDALYGASQAGVPVDLLIRGICALRPGRARAVGEHPGALDRRPLPGALAGHVASATAATPEFWIGSADLMHRNLDRRVEALVRVCDETAAHRAAPDPRRRHGPRRPVLGARQRRHLDRTSAAGDYQAELLRACR